MKHYTKISANDKESIHFISSLLQDSITCKLWIIYNKQQIKLLINRVCWEEKNHKSEHNRLLSIITIDNVKNAKITRMSSKIEFFTIQSIHCEKNNQIRIKFTNGTLLIKVLSFNIHLKDITNQWCSYHKFNENIKINNKYL
ncbi:hypothetical protein AB836_01585 [Rickettsiales bacterium (ex Bugula neritina AB1)]|nr:hypothetical protein AB836_01585 [Rickettsiales bacterium (ex Bugula neritina AB1)]